MPFTLGKKLGMSQVYDGDKRISVTVLEAGPITVAALRTPEKDGYSAVCIGFGTKKHKTKPQTGEYNNLPNFLSLKEFRVASEELTNYTVGQVLGVEVFEEGTKARISGLTKGRGFQGVVKRYSFEGGPKTHGQKNRHRAPGSIGATTPQQVIKGRRMAGRMGGQRKTIKNLTIIRVDKENQLIAIKGNVPGNKGSLIEITS
ncbi:MAG: 50S ribosomal protein L3 [Parcubacteria group bacterium]|nr:50S ribosomal protein L3 [Parcubacteria group bacterium]